MRRVALGCLLVAVLFCVSCYSYRFDGTLGDVPPASGRDEIPLFAYDSAAKVPAKYHGKTEKHDKFTVHEIKWRVKDFSELKHKHAKGYFYQPKNQAVSRPGLVILPPTGGPFDLVKSFAEYFAERGFVVVALRRRESFFNPEETLGYNESLIRQAVIDARRAVDFLDDLDYVDHDKTCLMGISLGGINGALAMASDERIKAAGFLVTAGHLPDILMTSGFGRVVALRHAMMKELDVDSGELKKISEPILYTVDPVTYADRLDPARIIMVNGAFDDIIRREVVMETYEDFGRPQLHFMPTGHYLSIGFAGFANKKIYRHFLHVLDIDPASLE